MDSHLHTARKRGRQIDRKRAVATGQYLHPKAECCNMAGYRTIKYKIEWRKKNYI
jgi:hypothetical protein